MKNKHDTLTGLIASWRDRAAIEARQSLAEVYLECAASLEDLIKPALGEFRERVELSNMKQAAGDGDELAVEETVPTPNKPKKGARY